VDKLPSLGPLKSVAVSGLSAVFQEAYNTEILQLWYLAIDNMLPCSTVKFADGLSISFWKTKQLDTKFSTGNCKVSKKVESHPSLDSHPALFKLSCALQSAKT
jgi:hypothetical protein